MIMAMVTTPHRPYTRRIRDRVQRHLVALPSLKLPGSDPDAIDPDVLDPDVLDPDLAGPSGCRLTVHRRMCGAVVVVTVHGDLVGDGARELGGRLQRILTGGSLARLVVDLGRVGQLSDAGVRALVRARDAGLAGGIPVRVVTPAGAAGAVLDRCDVHIPTAPDVDAACAEVFPSSGVSGG
jgi:anti-anti-sigma regulatory factor